MLNRVDYEQSYITPGSSSEKAHYINVKTCNDCHCLKQMPKAHALELHKLLLIARKDSSDKIVKIPVKFNSTACSCLSRIDDGLNLALIFTGFLIFNFREDRHTAIVGARC